MRLIHSLVSHPIRTVLCISSALATVHLTHAIVLDPNHPPIDNKQPDVLHLAHPHPPLNNPTPASVYTSTLSHDDHLDTLPVTQRVAEDEYDNGDEDEFDNHEKYDDEDDYDDDDEGHDIDEGVDDDNDNVNAIKNENEDYNDDDNDQDYRNDDIGYGYADVRKGQPPLAAQHQLLPPDSSSQQTYTPVRHDIRPKKIPHKDGFSSTGSPPAEDACSVVARYRAKAIPYETVRACLDSDFPFPDSLRANTVATVKGLLSNFYVYEDLAVSPPTADSDATLLTYKPVDLEKTVDRLLKISDMSMGITQENHDEDDNLKNTEKEKSDTMDGDNDGDDDSSNGEFESQPHNDAFSAEGFESEFATVLDNDDDIEDLKDDLDDLETSNKMTHRAFHDGISRIFAKARDGHLSYDADCFRAFRWQQGFFMNHVVRDGKVVIKVHSVTLDVALATGLKQDILNCDVVSIQGQDAVDYMHQWAETHVYMSKDTNVRFNAALATPQYRPGYADFFIPGKFGERYMMPEESHLDYVFKCPGKSPVKATVRWLGYYSRLRTKPFTDTQSYFDQNCMRNLMREVENALGGRRSRQEQEVQNQEEIKTVQEEKTVKVLQDHLCDLLAHPEKESTSITSENLQDAPMDLSKTETETETSFSAVPHEDTSNKQTQLKEIDDIVTQLDLLTAESLPVDKYYDDIGGRPSELSQSSSSAKYKELYKGAHDITAILLADGQTGVITVRTESSTVQGEAYSSVHPAWAGSLLRAIEVLRPVAKNLILDLTHNTGGYVCLGLTMIQIFFPDRPRLVTNIKLTPLSTQMLSAGALGMSHFVSSYGKRAQPALQDGYFLNPITHDNRNASFTDYISDRCAIADQYVLKVDPEVERKRNRTSTRQNNRDQKPLTILNDDGSSDDANEDETRPVYRPWDPENLAILSDGYCGSSCALISNMMHTKYGVRTVVIGGRTPASQEKSSPMTYSSFPGLQVIDDSLIFSEMHSVRLRMMS
ncbi:hypothetical protein BGZ94_007836, partial [Podila epigama]